MNAVHDAALDRDLAPGNAFEPGDHVQKRGLAAAGRTDEDQELAFLDGDVDPMQDFDRAVGFGDLRYVEKAHGDYPLTEPAIRPRTK